jgi:hypothetical protein
MPEIMKPIIPAPDLIRAMLNLVNGLPVEPGSIGVYIQHDGALYMPTGIRPIDTGDIVITIEEFPSVMPPSKGTEPT